MTIDRREFLAATAAALTAMRAAAKPLGFPIGCQTYPVRDSIGKDFDGTLKTLAASGFKTIEMCSPPGYSQGFGPLVGMKASEMRGRIEAAGLKCESCHYQFKELKENLDDRIAFAKELGLKQMVLSTFGLPRDAGMQDYLRAAGELNEVAEKTQPAGLLLGYHNHDNEFKEIDRALIYDSLMRTFDPRLVKLQFQTSVVSLGYEAATYFRKYPGRYISIHVADWSPTEKKQVAVGKGVINWKDLFAAAKTAGVRNYFVEMNLDLMQASVPYLKSLS
ncbi:MAG TPA: sugar phosphate isomerase/epimerase [Candidatus Sulfopaludibacter sp.]|jgi:sugar phosphate isomerase/epimerase|nr:sugar phosphate isomerase/epimerase [Candidatus Sulfopaludibacter sp.]